MPSRPAWNTSFTLVQFNLTAGVLGPLFAAAVGVGDRRLLALAAAVMAGAQVVLLALRFFRCIASDSLELRGTARLLSTVLAKKFVLRGVLLVSSPSSCFRVMRPRWLPRRRGRRDAWERR